MFDAILSPNQLRLAKALFPKLKGYYLAGGTALALQIGHRRSIDFDLAGPKPIRPFDIELRLKADSIAIEGVMVATGDEFTIIINGIKVTFLFFPFPIKPQTAWKTATIKLPSKMDLAAMKAYALGRRCKWKDYVDLYFLLKSHIHINDLIRRAKILFGANFNAKLFREQLCYFDDIDYSEGIDYLDEAPSCEQVKAFLEAVSIQF